MRFTILCLVIFIGACDRSTESLALGTLERDRIAHTATASEVVVALPVPQGNRVQKGTLLVKLDDQLQKTQVDRAAAQLAQARANLEKLRHGARSEEIAAARANIAAVRSVLVEHQANYQRVLNLKKQNLISQAELDKARAAQDSSQANLEGAQEALLELTNGTREEDLHAGEALVKVAMANLAAEEKHLADLSVVATRDGILDNLPWNLGERVTVGSPLAIVMAGVAPYARIYVPEPYRVKIRVGDSLRVRIDGVDEPIAGVVRWISNDPAFTPYYALNQEERSRLMYRAEIQLPDSAAELPGGVPVQVEMP